MNKQILELAKQQTLVKPAAILALIEVETGGVGFSQDTGKIIIQFEPVWFRRKAPYAPSGKWSVNGVERQSLEWAAFNDAFSKNANAAMEATSIGFSQIMGFHFKRLGYPTVGAMWDDAKLGLSQQFNQLLKFIQTDIKLISRLKALDWDGVATSYNGSGFRQLALKLKREPYDVSLKNAYDKYTKLGY